MLKLFSKGDSHDSVRYYKNGSIYQLNFQHLPQVFNIVSTDG